MIYTLLFLLFLKHFIIDFVLQSEAQVKGKGIYGNLTGITHSAEHAWTTAVIFALVMGAYAVGNWYPFVFGIVDGILHYHIDWFKQQLNKNNTPNDKQFWVLIGADQFLHALTYIGLVYVCI